MNATKTARRVLPRVTCCQPSLSDEEAARIAELAFETAVVAVEEAIEKLDDLANTGRHGVGREARSMARVLSSWAEGFVTGTQRPLRRNGRWVR